MTWGPWRKENGRSGVTGKSGTQMSIETRFDIPLVAELALREKQMQQSYRPIIAVHKWFARRPGTLFRALTLAEFGPAALADSFFTAQQLAGLTIADPFMGGGTPLIEANRLGCDVIGFDVNPMAAWIVREEIEQIDLPHYRGEADRLIRALATQVGELYRTDCPRYGDRDVPVKYFLWVKVIACESCHEAIDLFPGYRVAEDSRHPLHVLVCPRCGELNEVASLHSLGECVACQGELRLRGPASRGRCRCAGCGHETRYPRPQEGAPNHRLFAIEYHNPHRRGQHRGRFFKKPDEKDLARLEAARERWQGLRARFVPQQAILPGDETDRLHRWGYTKYRQLFNARQLLGLELSCRLIDQVCDGRVRQALATNLSDLLRYQNMLCRYDTWALKSLDIFSVHGFPVGLVQCESNLIGIAGGQRAHVGSGGWTNIIDKYVKAKRYCEAPFEVRSRGSARTRVAIAGEWIGEHLAGQASRRLALHCADAATCDLAPCSLDAVFTDPPYFGNVQYGELMDFCYVWLRALIGAAAEGFALKSTRCAAELTGNVTRARGLAHFTAGLGRVYARMARALKPGAPLAFTYHHNRLEAYHAVGVAILDAGLTCCACLPCPAEMGGSIHIHGTASSIVDTVFVCRDGDQAPGSWRLEGARGPALRVAADLEQLAQAGRQPTRGDARCVLFGHLTRTAVCQLRSTWDRSSPIATKLQRFARAVAGLGDPERLLAEATAACTRPGGQERSQTTAARRPGTRPGQAAARSRAGWHARTRSKASPESARGGFARSPPGRGARELPAGASTAPALRATAVPRPRCPRRTS